MKKSIATFVFAALSLSALPLWAASITQVKGAKALLEMSGLENAQAGDEFYAVDEAGKRKAILRLQQVKKGKAIADVVKGKPQTGYNLVQKGAAKAAAAPAEGETGTMSDAAFSKARRYTGNSWGLTFGMLQTSMSVDIRGGGGSTGQPARSSPAAMSGSAFGITGYYDYAFSPAFQFRGVAGYEQLKAAGSISYADCSGGTTTCDFNVNYLSLYGVGKFNLLKGNTRLWIGGGYGFLIAMSKSSTALNTSQISTNQLYTVSTGLDISVGRQSYIPIILEYGMFPASDTVKANVLYARVGYAWNL